MEPFAATKQVRTIDAKQQVLQCFFNTDLRCGHDGLKSVAKKSGLDVTKLEPGKYIVFVNSHKDRLKLYAANNVVAYWKAMRGQKLNMHVISEIPRSFSATGTMDYDSALRSALEKQMQRRIAVSRLG